MTRQDYIAFADELRAIKRSYKDNAIALDVLDVVIQAIIVSLQEDNPRFDIDKFMEAIG